jgi:hypothetical protein
MKKTIIFIIGFMVLIGLCIGVYILLNNHPAQTQTGQPDTNSAGGSPGVTVPNYTQTNTNTVKSDNTLSVATADGGTVLVKDFIANGAAVKDPSNKGHYYLAGMFSATYQNPPYSIVYNSSDQSFTISLWQTPLGATRTAAEQELAKDLNISKPFLCSLRYRVGTTNQIDKTYGGINLGMSFCVGATQLP